MIHPTAIIDPSAQLADDVDVGPYSIIGADVEIDTGTVIGPHVVIKGPTRIGKHNRVFQFATLGEDCQDKKYAGEPTRLVIGDHNVIRESCTFHRGTVQDNSETRIGSHNLFMVNVHVAHDCIVGDHCILANDTNLAGHVQLGDWAILGGATQVHQFCKIGAHVMAGAGTVVLKDIPAYVMALGYPAEPHGINSEGLRRRGYSADAISAVRNAYKTVYRQGLTLTEALAKLEQEAVTEAAVGVLFDSLKDSSRGIIR
ncbi:MULTISPECIES: acyl-ACP--UDP-N-acetylglucosamine O-acyltransferase [unclassified Oceanobacter]|uniref:acyl-ACP--UDP-N-acetylglucosamine O-acyltransferase n=1 Tax=unclassified Oceanobacter TaxID=2620260 RepID=UPI002734357D|nr:MULTISPECIES: acyl-ACP--UDP-N-acetylglucosamine O-acyltransferase [unclassified Oceanobacter]MDP2504883.1 acyl-ACP--UDP-N-acetylglucosamine O-acyltransferase [Oceanobacter sp. 3_MG-2023]MDP2546327.1 acyl-ACP--UDP-N-acetylglucosamine O-acyltransferase [Oceanobacter sp. 4_MG-2023]